MPSFLRHLTAVLLLALLPFQAIAAGYDAASATLLACSDEMIAMGCCENDSMNGNGCHAASCFAAAAVAPPRLALVSLPAPLPAAPVVTVARLHESYIPDGPQRPPRARS
ncbi:MAG TPA: hypothetical protein VGC21_02175 [Telluria sp.]|jgi:hypothetical protein